MRRVMRQVDLAALSTARLDAFINDLEDSLADGFAEISRAKPAKMEAMMKGSIGLKGSMGG